MATSASYYLNAPSLGSASAIFTDEALSICAPNGFYSNGSIVREQLECILLPQQTCPSCATPCNLEITTTGGQGIYLLDINTKTTSLDVGAVIVRFNPNSIPDGIRATLGTSTYNKLTSSVDGLHQSSNVNSFTYVGDIASDCEISGTTYPSLSEFLYDGTSFNPTGNTQSITVDSGDVSLGASAPGSCLMVIPKLIPSPSIINFEIVGPCTVSDWVISIACPELLTGFNSSVMSESSEAVCSLSETVTYYNASLADTPGIVGLYDFVYADAYGSTPLDAGYYLAKGSITGGHNWFQVDSSGVVIALGDCPTADLAWSYNEVNGGTGEMILYINGLAVETRTATDSGIYAVTEGDTINIQLTCNQCTIDYDIFANAYCTGLSTASNCSSTGPAFLFVFVYTVLSGDIGTTLYLDTFARCDSICV